MSISTVGQIAISTTIIILILMGGAVASPMIYDAVAGDITDPRSPLWTFERMGESMRMTLTWGSIAKAKLHLELAEERLKELNACRGYPALMTECAIAYTRHMNSSLSICEDAEERGLNATEVYILVYNMTEKHCETLEEIEGIAPEEAKPAIQHAQECAEKGHEEASEKLEEREVEHD